MADGGNESVAIAVNARLYDAILEALRRLGLRRFKVASFNLCKPLRNRFAPNKRVGGGRDYRSWSRLHAAPDRKHPRVGFSYRRQKP